MPWMLCGAGALTVQIAGVRDEEDAQGHKQHKQRVYAKGHECRIDA